MTGSNRRPSACKADALPAELITQFTANCLRENTSNSGDGYYHHRSQNQALN